MARAAAASWQHGGARRINQASAAGVEVAAWRRGIMA